MENDIKIKVVYNGIMVELILNRHIKAALEPIIETFVFKNINDFNQWFEKNFSTPKKSKEFLIGLYELRNKININSKDYWTYSSTGTGLQYQTNVSTTNAAGTI